MKKITIFLALLIMLVTVLNFLAVNVDAYDYGAQISTIDGKKDSSKASTSTQNVVGAILQVARIAAVADAFDAMTSKRTYRDSLPIEVVREEIEKNLGTQFDPEIGNCFLDIIDNEYDKIKELTVGVVEENIAKERITLSPQLLLELARRKERENCYVDVNELVPMYMRKSQAEESLKTN